MQRHMLLYRCPLVGKAVSADDLLGSQTMSNCHVMSEDTYWVVHQFSA